MYFIYFIYDLIYEFMFYSPLYVLYVPTYAYVIIDQQIYVIHKIFLSLFFFYHRILLFFKEKKNQFSRFYLEKTQLIK